MYKTIIYSSKDGLLYVDAAGVIQVRNRVIRQMNGDISLMDRPLKQALPYLYKMFRCVITSGQEESGRILTIPGTRSRCLSAAPRSLPTKKFQGWCSSCPTSQ